MTNATVHDRFTFNSYDLFSNFLPGAVLLFGLSPPFFNSQELFPELSLIEVLFATILAFGGGIATQSLGSMVSRRRVFGWYPWQTRTRPFNEKMNRMLSSESRGSNCSNIDWAAQQICIEVFDLNGDGTDDCEHIFKSLLAYLESSKWSRGLRIQSLHLASRGLYIVCLILGVYFGAFALGLWVPVNQPYFTYGGFLSGLQFTVLSVSMVPASWILFKRARHFEADVVVYVLAEFYMSQFDWNEFELSTITASGPDTEQPPDS